MRNIDRIAAIIAEEQVRFDVAEPLAEQLRWAAWAVREAFPSTTSGEFGDAAASLSLHRQGAMNRWNEAMKNWEVAFG